MSLGLLPTPTVQICKAAKAVFNVAPGNFYLSQYLEYDKANGTTKTIDAIANLAGGTDAVFSANVLTNLGLAGDTAGQAFLESTIASSGRGAALTAAFDFLATVPASNATYGTPAQVFTSSVTKSVVYSSNVANNSTDVATLTAAVTVVVDATGAPVAALAEGQTLTLTTSTDAGSKFVGGSGPDIFAGVVTADGGTGTTAQPGDTIAGGDGNDVLNLSFSGGLAADHTLAAMNTSSIETVLASNFETHASRNNTIDASLMTGVTTFGVQASSANGDTIVSNIKTLVDTEMRNGAGDLTLTYNATVVAGTADEQSLKLSAMTAGTFNADGIETLNITSEIAKNKLLAVTQTTAVLNKLVVAGDVDLEITNTLDFKAGVTDGDATIDATVDASAFTGKLTLLLNDANDLSVTTGTGADTIKMAATLSKFDVIDTGDGADVVEITGHNGATALKMSDLQLTNVETFKVAGNGGAVTLLNADSSPIVQYSLTENGTTSIDATINNLGATPTVTIENTVDNQAVGIVTAALKDASGTADSITVNVNGTSGQAAETMEQIIVTNVETINLSSGSVGATAMVTGDSNVITDQSYSTATNLNITGAANLTMTNAIVGTKLTTIDASAFTGNLTLTAAAVDLDLKGGTGADAFTLGTTLTIADVIDGGSNPSSTSVDTLTATINETGTSALAAALQIANVETVTFNTATNASFIDAAAITGATQINIEHDQDVTLSNLAAGTNLMLGIDTAGGLDDYSGTLTASLADETGAADALTVKLSKQGTDDDINATLVTNAALETLTIQASTNTATTNDVTLNVVGVKSPTLAVTKGDASELVVLGTLNAGTTALDASGYDGLLSVTGSATGTTFTIKNGENANTIAGGAGNDTFIITDMGATTTSSDANGGTGTDSLTGTLTGSITEKTTGFETVTYVVGNNKQPVVTAANGAGVDTAKTFNLSGGDSLSTFAIDYTSPAVLTKIDMSAYTGKSTQHTFAAQKLVNTMDIIGSAGTDTVIATTASGAAAAVKSMSGVETLSINVAGGDTSFDFTKTSGITKVKIDDDGTARVATLTDLEAGVTVEATAGIASSGVVIDQLNKTDLDNAQTVEMKVTNAQTDLYTINASDIETLTVKMTAPNGVTLGLSANAMTTAGKTSSLILTGKTQATIETIHADTTTIDASGMTTGGSVVQEARSTTAGVNYTGSLGADTFIMRNAADVMSAGTGLDTLDINFAAILGGLNVDLSSTTDQIAAINGTAASGTITGFDNVKADGYTGSFGAQIKAGALGSIITGTANVDDITLTTGKSDSVLATDQVASATLVNTDVIAGFVGGSTNGDKITISMADVQALTTVSDFVKGTTSNKTGAQVSVVQEIPDGTIFTMGATATTLVYTGSTKGTIALMVNELEASGSTDMTVTTSPTAKDSWTLLWSDGTDAYFSAITTGATNAIIGNGDLSGVNLVKLTGVSSIAAGDFVSANFEFIA